jgi:Zn-finger nucleic acid-binding protein
MNCPHCIDQELYAETVEESLTMQTCHQCHGRFLTSTVYFDWLEAHGPNLPETSSDAATRLETVESQQAKRCPDCGAILVPYKVGRETGFSLDRCWQCGGIWFEQNEWEILRSRNLHDDIHLIFTKPWQEEVRQRELARQREMRLRQSFGDADYEELIRVKAWLDAHPKSRELYSYLLNEARVLPL